MYTDNIEKRVRYIGHEIRNQLSICDIYSEIIRKHLAKSNIENPSIENALNCIQSAVKLIGNNLIDLKSIDNSQIRVFNSSKFIKECVELSVVYSQNKKISYVADDITDVLIKADDNKLKGCLINILKNAAESIDNSGIIEFQTKEDENFLYIYISNTGNPIPDNIQREIFDDGFTTKNSGSGIGLFLCKSNLNSMGGDITLKESNSKHTVFEIKIPKANI